MCYSPKCIRKNFRFANATSQVAATTLMTHCVSQISTAFQDNGNISLAVAFLFAKLLAKLNLKGLTTLRSKNTSTWDAVTFVC